MRRPRICIARPGLLPKLSAWSQENYTFPFLLSPMRRYVKEVHDKTETKKEMIRGLNKGSTLMQFCTSRRS